MSMFIRVFGGVPRRRTAPNVLKVRIAIAKALKWRVSLGTLDRGLSEAKLFALVGTVTAWGLEASLAVAVSSAARIPRSTAFEDLQGFGVRLGVIWRGLLETLTGIFGGRRSLAAGLLRSPWVQLVVVGADGTGTVAFKLARNPVILNIPCHRVYKKFWRIGTVISL